jgi:predicted outer membrane repeat protein
MFLSSWLRNSKRSALAAGRRTKTSRRQVDSFRPRLELLEDRWLPSTLTVTNTSDNGSGSLRAAIAGAQGGDTIVFSRKLFHSGRTTTITLTSNELDLTKDLTIQGPGAGELTISGYSPAKGRGGVSTDWRVFEVAPLTTVTLSGLTISKGNGFALNSTTGTAWNDYGGGILNLGTLTVSGCTVSGNSAVQEGGGIFSDGTLTVSGCTLSGNSAFYGAGISNHGTATLQSSIVSNNTCVNDLSDSYDPPTEGGGIFNQGTLSVSGCTISGNFANYQGGGIFNDGTLIISACSVSANWTFHGGDGIYNASVGIVTVENSSSITGNQPPSGYSAAAIDDVYNGGVLYVDSTSTIGTVSGNPAILI